MAAPRAVTTVTITNGASLSGAATIGKATLVGILMPATWTAAAITFQASADGVTFGNYVNAAGTEVTIASAAAAASQFIPLNPTDFIGAAYLKVRSGTSGAAVNQGGDRLITLVLAGI